MKILSVTQNRIFKGVFFETWDLLKAGLEEYMFGPRDADGQFPKLEFGDKRQRALLDKLYETVPAILDSDYRWSHKFDYDAYGTAVFKTEVKIKRVVSRKHLFDADTTIGYILDLWVAHSDDKDAERFAKELGRNLVLYSHDIEVSAEPIDETRFELDLDPILACVQQAFPKMKVLSQATVAQDMAERVKYDRGYDEDHIRDNRFVIVGTPDKTMMIRISTHDSVRSIDWVVNGNKISGSRTTWYGKAEPEIPKIVIRISKYWNRYEATAKDRRIALSIADQDLPICTLKEQNQYTKAAGKITAALGQLVQNS